MCGRPRFCILIVLLMCSASDQCFLHGLERSAACLRVMSAIKCIKLWKKLPLCTSFTTCCYSTTIFDEHQEYSVVMYQLP